MGQVLLPDNIPNRTVDSATQVSLPATAFGQPTRITIGGQQYKLDAAVSCDLTTNGIGGLDTGSLVADTTYYIYAIYNVTAVALVCSTSGSGPTGFTVYTPVGSFATDGSAQASNIEIFEAGASYQGPISTADDLTATGTMTAGAHLEAPSVGFGADTTWNSDGFDVTDISFMDVDGTSRTITGFTGGAVGQVITIVNQSGSGYYRFQQNTGAFTPLILPATDIILAPFETISFIRRGGLWFMSHKTTKNEYLSDLTSDTTVASTSYVDLGASINLTPGWWDIGYDVTVRMAGGSTIVYGKVVIADSGNNDLANTASMSFSASGTQNWSDHSRSTRVFVASSTTYKLRGVTTTTSTYNGYMRIYGTTVTGLPDPDTESFIWARRIN